jgi:branched-chain amino acid transport system ATP-binding protein
MSALPRLAGLSIGTRFYRLALFLGIGVAGDHQADCAFPVLRERRDQLGGFLLGSEQQMLTIARTLTGNPELLPLDEPSEGLAPLVVDTLRDKIAELKAQHLAIRLAEQCVDFALALADRVYVLEKGVVRHSGGAAELRADPALVDRLLSL